MLTLWENKRLLLIALVTLGAVYVLLSIDALYPTKGLQLFQLFAGAILDFPGSLLEFLLALASGRGAHGSVLPRWLITIISWLFYAWLIVMWLARRRRLRSVQDPSD